MLKKLFNLSIKDITSRADELRRLRYKESSVRKLAEIVLEESFFVWLLWKKVGRRDIIKNFLSEVMSIEEILRYPYYHLVNLAFILWEDGSISDALAIFEKMDSLSSDRFEDFVIPLFPSPSKITVRDHLHFPILREKNFVGTFVGLIRKIYFGDLKYRNMTDCLFLKIFASEKLELQKIKDFERRTTLFVVIDALSVKYMRDFAESILHVTDAKKVFVSSVPAPPFSNFAHKVVRAESKDIFDVILDCADTDFVGVLYAWDVPNPFCIYYSVSQLAGGCDCILPKVLAFANDPPSAQLFGREARKLFRLSPSESFGFFARTKSLRRIKSDIFREAELSQRYLLRVRIASGRKLAGFQT